jgi:phage terminase large subunit-like protein
LKKAVDPKKSEKTVRALGLESLQRFVRLCWHILEPKTVYTDNWHIKTICEHLEAVARGEIQNLLVNIPPRCMKSLLISVYFPVWQWLKNPGHRFLCASYAQTLSTRDAVKARRLIQSPYFQRHWGRYVQMQPDQNTKNRYDTKQSGYRIATSVGGLGTGEGGDTIIVDDPHNTQGALSEVKRLDCITWWDETMSTRLNDAKTGSKIVVMQRLHEHDLTGHILKREPEEWVHLCLPMRYEGGERDIRKKHGQLLWPEKFPEKEVKKLETRLGIYGTASQLQMRPGARGGNMLNVSKIKYYDDTKKWPEDIQFMRVIDFAHSEKQRIKHDPDFTSATLVGFKQIDGLWNMYVKHVFRTQAAVTKRDRALAGLIGNDEPSVHVLLERTTDSLDACDQWKEKLWGKRIVEEWKPKIDKIVRASHLEPIFDAGNVHVLKGEWVREWVDEVQVFPAGSHDDMVDNLGAGFCYTIDGVNKIEFTVL